MNQDGSKGVRMIGFSHAERYCVVCGAKESYNGNRPLTAPTICRKCGGRMTDAQTEEIFKKLEQHLSHTSGGK